ncbi:hypothetical protein FRB96_000869 [Tulasnella sp. 330]|nr:hypothetical protein FRB96_000869 [Tulasnella sp. 330]KAG8882719.1 hypothetical protein FRB97_007859 [Tulasnella sp. 331]
MLPPLSIWSWSTRDQDAPAKSLEDARSIIMKNFGANLAGCWSTRRKSRTSVGDWKGLKEFQSTDFRHLVCQIQHAPGDDMLSPVVRKKFDMNKIIPPVIIRHLLTLPGAYGFLAMLLYSQPHLIISEEGISAQPRITGIREHAIASHLTSNVREALKDVHGRLTWIIPITRKLPCRKKITSAVMALDENDTEGITASQARAVLTHGTPELIAWTPQDLLIFWLWLHDTLKRGIFGSLTLSITSMKLPKSAEEIEADRTVASAIIGRRRRNSRRIHYIALHHGSTYSLRLRTYMGHFDPQHMVPLLLPESQKILAQNWTRPARQRAVLKNAKLLLVDREQKGVLVG